TTIEAGARATQPTQAGTVRSGAVSAELECVAAIASARTQVATATMSRSLRCQRVRDHGAVTTGPLAPDCQIPAEDDVIRTAAGRIAGACRVAGIGDCAGLPQCALDAAIETGIELARISAG